MVANFHNFVVTEDREYAEWLKAGKENLWGEAEMKVSVVQGYDKNLKPIEVTVYKVIW